MKKLFTLMAVALMGVAVADASITVKKGSEEVKDGGVVTMTNSDVKDASDGKGILFQAGIDLHVTTNSAPIKFDMTGDSGNITICEYLGTCHPLFDNDEDGIFKGSFENSNNDIILQVDGPLTTLPYPKLKNYIDVVATDALGNKLSFRVVLDTTGEASVNGVVADKAVFSVKNGRAYVNGSANGVEVYNLLGQRVSNDALHGVYLVKAGKAVKKVVVK